jgi:hypothetical protein
VSRQEEKEWKRLQKEAKLQMIKAFDAIHGGSLVFYNLSEQQQADKWYYGTVQEVRDGGSAFTVEVKMLETVCKCQCSVCCVHACARFCWLLQAVSAHRNQCYIVALARTDHSCVQRC